ncbi:anthranilate phosphoribosyltransferase, partial [Salmonella enterica subsp. enterica serovar Enteritidis]
MDTIFNKLFAGQQLSLEESQTLFSAIIRGELTES